MGRDPLRTRSGLVWAGSVPLPGQRVSRVLEADREAVGGQRCLPKDPNTGSNGLRAIQKPLPLHGRSLGPPGVVGSSLRLRGFAGAPWTVGCSPIGRGCGDNAKARLQRLLCRHGEEQHLCQEGPTTSQVVAPGDTSHCHSAACDVPSEVSWGRQEARAGIRFSGPGSVLRGGHTIPGRGACLQRTLNLVAENTPTLSISHPPRPVDITSSISPRLPTPPLASLASSASSLLVPSLSKWT